jgi:hypothetical protein
MTDNLKGTSTEETFRYLSESNEALRMENARLLSKIQRMQNNIEVHEAEIITHNNGLGEYYNFINNFNYTLKND